MDKQEFLIFKCGKYPQGDYPKEKMQTYIDSFNSAKDEIPVMIGHKYFSNNDEDEFAHGWIKTLRLDGAGKIFAVDYEFDDYIKEKIAKKNLKKISIEIFGDGSDEKPFQITGCALLGRTIPAVSQTFLPNVFNKIMGINNEKNDLNNFQCVLDLNIKGEDSMNDEEKKAFSDLQKSVGDLTQVISGFSTKFQEMDKIVKTFSDNIGNDKEKEDVKYFEDLKKDGKITPAEFENAVNTFKILTTSEQKEVFKKNFENKKPVFDKGHFAKEGNNFEGDVYSQIKAFQTENKIESFEAASKAFYLKHPEAFEVGGDK